MASTFKFKSLFVVVKNVYLATTLAAGWKRYSAFVSYSVRDLPWLFDKAA